MFKVQNEANIITAENRIKSRKCFSLLRKEIKFCLDGLKDKMHSKHLIELYTKILQICNSETRSLEKYFVNRIRSELKNHDSLAIWLHLELCYVECNMNFGEE
jgi:hypothetical protein